MRRPAEPCRAPLRLLAAGFGGLLALAVLPANAANAHDARTVRTDAKSVHAKNDLQATRAQLDALKKDLDSTRSSREDTLKALRRAEAAIAAANAALARLAQQQQTLTRSLDALGAQIGVLQKSLAAQQAVLERMLVSQYRAGGADPLQILLDGDDPEQLDRHLLYYRRLYDARARMIGHMRGDLARLHDLKQSQSQQQQSLAQNAQEQNKQKARLLQEQNTRKQLLARLADKIDHQRREIGQLERNERQLSQLVERLARAARARPAPARPRGAGRAPAPAAERPPRITSRLPLPVAGSVANRFGAARPEGGANWKGVFIRAAAGAPVRAVAAGEVVYADWLRGFGNLLIIDHGGGFMSLYGNNAALLRRAGQRVAAGETVATVGNSGGNPQPGVYYELRVRGQPVDPLTWAGR